MTEAERLAIEWQCSRLIALYANLNDAAQWKELADLYTEDGVMARPSQPDTLISGRGTILAAFINRPARATRHVCSNMVIDVESPTSARGHSAMVLFQPGSPPLAGSFRDRFELTGSGWRFAERLGSLSW